MFESPSNVYFSHLQVYDDLPVVEDLSGVRVDDDDLMAISSRLKKAKKAKKKKVRFLYIYIFRPLTVLF